MYYLHTEIEYILSKLICKRQIDERVLYYNSYKMELLSRAKKLEKDLIDWSDGILKSEDLGIVEKVRRIVENDVFLKFKESKRSIPEHLTLKEKLSYLSKHIDEIEKEEISNFVSSLGLNSMKEIVEEWLINYRSLPKAFNNINYLGFLGKDEPRNDYEYNDNYEDIMKRETEATFRNRILLVRDEGYQNFKKIVEYIEENEDDIEILLDIGFQIEVLIHNDYGRGVDTYSCILKENFISSLYSISERKDFNRIFLYLQNPNL